MKKRAFRPQLESCVQCGAVEDNECDEQWVACDNCVRWWHVHCTDTPTMSAQEFNLIIDITAVYKSISLAFFFFQ